MSQARGIVFYGSVTSFGQHFKCYMELHNSVALMLLSGHQKLGDLARETARFLAPLMVGYKHIRSRVTLTCTHLGKPLSLVFFTSQLSK